MQIDEHGGSIAFFSQHCPLWALFLFKAFPIQAVLFKILVPLVHICSFELFR